MEKVCMAVLGCLLFSIQFNGLAQVAEKPDDLLKPEFHQAKREQLRRIMPPNSVAVFFSNAVRSRSNDGFYKYHPDPNFYYLTGYQEPDAVLLIFKENQTINKKESNEIIFVRQHDALKELYDGARLGKEGAREKLKLQVAYEGPEFENFPLDFSKYDKVFFYDFFNDVRDTDEKGDLFDLIEQFKQKVGYTKKDLNVTIEPKKNNIDLVSLDGLMKKLRGIKSPEEIVLLRKAINISAVGQVEAMKSIRPGMSEMQVQGLHEFIHKSYTAEDQGYQSIVGAGHNGCVLHYRENQKPAVQDGELILMDVGAQYRGYTADVTRTIPVNGKFTKEQKQIYDLVYKAQTAAWEICKEGTTFDALKQITEKVINEGLVELKLYKSTSAADIVDPATGRNRYNPHGCCHHIGLDVHDKGDYDLLKEGMVITIEPGIYIPKGSPAEQKWWDIPVRIEDDFLIKKDGCELLSEMAPRKSDEIEMVMKESGVLQNLQLPDISQKK
ncbi:MAG TPA: aminopeptidase P N-terminal domain-containing protein [Chryseolinea sp.]|nr:aminopeptidase P N-terminal domain-containing protein [Chryseolinea sp.]